MRERLSRIPPSGPRFGPARCLHAGYDFAANKSQPLHLPAETSRS